MKSKIISQRIIKRRVEKGIENWPNCKPPSCEYLEILRENLSLLTPCVYRSIELNEERV